MREFENVERMFNEDIREKKRAGRGVFSMRGKGVKHGMSGALKTPYYYMTNKEKKNLNGKVEVKNMYETIIPFKEFELKDKDLQRTMLLRWRELYSNLKIMADMGLNNTNYYRLVEELGIPKKPRTYDSATGKKRAAKKEESKNIAISAEIKEDKPIEVIQKLVSNGLYFEYNGVYNCESLAKLFTKLQLLVDGEENDFQIELSISEVERKRVQKETSEA